MYLGDLGQEGHTGERFRIISSSKGGRAPVCPTGTTQESSGTLGTGQKYSWCHRAPQFRAPPVTTTTISPTVTTLVPTAVSTQVSPQISPTLAQQQASPGATVAASPQQQAAGPVAAPSADASEGIEAAEMFRYMREQDAIRREDKIAADLAAHEAAGAVQEREAVARQVALDQQRADEAQRTAEDRARAAEYENMMRTIVENAAPDPRDVAAEVINGGLTAGAINGGGAMLMPMPPAPGGFSTPGPMGPPGAAGESLAPPAPAPDEAATPWALILLAAAGVGAVVLMGGKKGKRKRVKK